MQHTDPGESTAAALKAIEVLRDALLACCKGPHSGAEPKLKAPLLLSPCSTKSRYISCKSTPHTLLPAYERRAAHSLKRCAMSDHSPRLPQPTRRRLPIYPPVWYLDLVQLRSRLSEETATTGMHSVWSADPTIADSDRAESARLMALALEIVRPSRLERLPYSHQAHILGLDVLEVREYLGETLEGIGVQASAATLIIEDEAAVALDLARIVRQTGHRICGTASRLEQALAVAGRTHPALVLADVQLKDGPEAGIAAVQEIGRTSETAAVYVTAYPERVRHAVSEPLIVSKPFVAHDIQTAMWRALIQHGCGALAAAA